MADPEMAGRNGGVVSPIDSSHEKPPIGQVVMAKGDGKESYSKNSAPQGSWVDQAILPCIYEALDHIALQSHDRHGPIRVADLGCSSGPNTIRNVHLIVEKLREQFSAESTEFQAFFNDLPANDFNNLFKLLSGEVGGNFFAAGVPGSFFGRLCPRSTIHVFLSTVAIHFVSKSPDAVVEKGSPASNKGHWRLAPHSSVATGIAYREQASTDLKTFLEARAAELAPGGLLCFAGMARTSPDPTNQIVDDDVRDATRAALYSSLDDAWSGLLSEGLITEEQSNMINWPTYNRNLEEVLEDAGCYSSEFEVLSAKMVRPKMWVDSMDPIQGPINYFKAVIKPFFAGHLRDEINEILWQRFEQKFRQRANYSLEDFTKGVIHMYFVALIRRGS